MNSAECAAGDCQRTSESTERMNMECPNLEQMKRFDESHLPDLDGVVFAALEQFMWQGLPRLDLGRCPKPLVVGSGNSAAGGKEEGRAAKGRPIPSNDVWIAANAMKHGMALYSFDRHFDAIDGLPRV